MSKVKPTDKDYKALFEDMSKQGPKAVAKWKENYSDGIMTPEEFFKELDKPVESKAWRFFKDVEEGKSNIEVDESSRFILYELNTGKWKWTKVKNKEELKTLMEQSAKAPEVMARLREAKTLEYLRKRSSFKEDQSGGYGWDSDSVLPPQSNQSGYEIKHEYTPLMGTPFFKQLYLYDMLLMHSKTFWYKNYSGPAKLILSLYRSFVIGKGFGATIKDPKAEKAWKAYEERSGIHEKLPVWHDELMFAGELMLEKKMRREGLTHESIDPSTVWDIITDPENISDVKYYHQQYPTQYQLFSAPGAPITKYIIRHIPPELVHHIKINVTSWEKRGRSDLLAALLYLKYFDDYVGFKLQRTKGETAYFWDVTIKGDASDVSSYITTTQSIVDVNPGSENVHNEAVTRQPMAPSMSHTGSDEVAKWILAYIGMSALIPSSYFGTFETAGSSRASALVSTEPIIKVMEERRAKLEDLLHRIWEDVMIDAGLDPKSDVEFNFPELVVEDRSKKLEDLKFALDEKIITHKRFSEIAAKELNISTYDYEEEQEMIGKEQVTNPNLLDMDTGLDLTDGETGDETKGGHAFDRDSAKKDNTTEL